MSACPVLRLSWWGWCVSLTGLGQCRLDSGSLQLLRTKVLHNLTTWVQILAPPLEAVRLWVGCLSPGPQFPPCREHTCQIGWLEAELTLSVACDGHHYEVSRAHLLLPGPGPDLGFRNDDMNSSQALPLVSPCHRETGRCTKAWFLGMFVQ